MFQTLTDAVALLGAIDADAYPVGTYTTGWVDAKHFQAFAALIAPGDLGSGASINAKLEQATSAGGSGVKNIGSAITALTQAGTDDNKQAWINVRGGQLDANNGFAYLRLSMTVAGATSDVAAYLFGFCPSRGPAHTFDASTVDEIVN